MMPFVLLSCKHWPLIPIKYLKERVKESMTSNPQRLSTTSYQQQAVALIQHSMVIFAFSNHAEYM